MADRSVRSLSRGLTLIRELNMSGPSSVQQLAERTERLTRSKRAKAYANIGQPLALQVCSCPAVSFQQAMKFRA